MGMPPTLGDRLDERMWSLDHGAPDVAVVVGASHIEIGAWVIDAEVPGPEFHWALAEYLGVDVPEVRRLVLRSQMRIVQRTVRTMPASEASGF
jgi:hypothetical protein